MGHKENFLQIISKIHLLHIRTPQETLASDKKRVSQHLIKNYQVFPTTRLSLYPMRSRN
jgi:hypothetical protein